MCGWGWAGAEHGEIIRRSMLQIKGKVSTSTLLSSWHLFLWYFITESSLCKLQLAKSQWGHGPLGSPCGSVLGVWWWYLGILHYFFGGVSVLVFVQLAGAGYLLVFYSILFVPICVWGHMFPEMDTHLSPTRVGTVADTSPFHLGYTYMVALNVMDIGTFLWLGAKVIDVGSMQDCKCICNSWGGDVMVLLRGDITFKGTCLPLTTQLTCRNVGHIPSPSPSSIMVLAPRTVQGHIHY